MQGLLQDGYWGLDQLLENGALSISLLIRKPKEPRSLPSLFQAVTGTGLDLWLASQTCLLLSASLTPLSFRPTSLLPISPPPPLRFPLPKLWLDPFWSMSTLCWRDLLRMETWWGDLLLALAHQCPKGKSRPPTVACKAFFLWPKLPYLDHFPVTSALTL